MALFNPRLFLDGFDYMEVFEDIRLQANLDMWQYQGFDYIAMLKAMRDKARDPDDLKADIRTLLAILLLRGTNTIKIKSKSKKEAQDIIDVLVKKYSITGTKQRGTPLDATSCTLARIGAAFAKPITQVYSHAGSAARVVAVGLPVDYPLAMSHSFFGGVIPKTLNNNELEILRDAYLLHQYRFDRTINGRNLSTKAALETYVTAAINGNVVSEEDRKTLCQNANLCVVNGTTGVVTLAPANLARLTDYATAYRALPG